MAHRVEQVAELIQEEVDSIIRFELTDPRIGLVSVTRVTVSSDLQSATIFVSVVEADEEDDVHKTMRALAGAERFIRRELASRMDLRHVPEIHFRLDEGIEHARRVEELLDKLRAEGGEGGSETPPTIASESTPS